MHRWESAARGKFTFLGFDYFLGEFAMSEGQGGGEFYTPASIMQLLAQGIEPLHALIPDPACGLSGIFVPSARFVAEHYKDPAAELAICGVEKADETGRVARLNPALHGLEATSVTAATIMRNDHPVSLDALILGNVGV